MKNYVELSRRHFNKQANQYDSNTSGYYSGPAKISCADVQKFLLNQKYETLLDVGCGTGWLLEHLSNCKNAEYYGLDLSENMLEIARSKNIKNAELVQGYADSLPYDDNSFDIVTCIQSFHHYPDPDKAMREVYRVLKPNGLYILSDTGVGGIGAWFDNNILFKLMQSGDCHTENRKDLARRMEKNGFRKVKSKQLKGFIYTVIGQK